MTAVNIFMEPDGAYLMTDRAHYDQKGVVLGICRKVLYRTGLKAAVAFSGMADVDRIAAVLDTLAPKTQDDLLRDIPTVAAEVHRQNHASSTSDRLETGVQIFACVWSDVRGRPEAWFCSTNQAYFPESYQPGTLQQISHLTVPQVDTKALFAGVALEDRPRALVEAQRRIPWIDDGVERYFVGGGWDLTAVTKDGVLSAPSEDWPDKVGEVITP